jgi:AcrR family transcriptional regulator
VYVLLLAHSEIDKMTTAEKSNDPSGSRLTRNDWIKAAIETLKNQGVDNIKVDPIAKQLSVSRGSFYWHFNKRQNLLDGVLSYWESVSTLDIIEQLEQSPHSPDSRLRQLLTMALTIDSENFSFERAIRAWAVKENNVRQVLTAVDHKRIGYLQMLISQLGWDAEQAKQHAQLVYYFRTGLYHQGQVPELAQRLQTVTYLCRILNCG